MSAVGGAALLPSAGHADSPSSSTAGSLACPVAGESTYEDSYGWARSGGRRHKGVDMVAGRGTPIVAVADGEATFKSSRLGGRSVWLYTDDGAKFFYAHLEGWEGESRTVEAGEVIGYLGSSGNAGGPHLHFETHYGGSTANPYPAVLEACTRPACPASVPSAPLVARLR
ncbi:MAG: M23 family metallopeptidase [Ilumatobacteraceae bacterium]